ncbi:hypothetical protein GCM10023187_43100 [Nibrella viscosa]|uniref:Aminoglycoside phosphotransferase domain-containing protein n=1 Tax=Nibrella viscosa TaxID=1084524 RepID=A0ABP8KS57_9BACT
MFDDQVWQAEEPDIARHEAATLQKLASTDLPAPRLIAVDETGAIAGMPMVLMTHLEGQVDLQPKNLHRWLADMAGMLARIHAIPPGDFAWKYYRYNQPEQLRIPDWSGQPAVWQQALAIAGQVPPEGTTCLLHRDYHPTNILWNKDQLSAIVDWPNACEGPPGVDVGHCRLNLALLMGIAEAEQFLAAYQAAAPSFRHEPYWDVVAALEFLPGPPAVYPPWREFGVTGLMDELITSRYDAYVSQLVGKISM